jgi:hypothetical protein
VGREIVCSVEVLLKKRTCDQARRVLTFSRFACWCIVFIVAGLFCVTTRLEVQNGALGPFGWAGGVTAWGSGAGARANDGGLACLRLWLFIEAMIMNVYCELRTKAPYVSDTPKESTNVGAGVGRGGRRACLMRFITVCMRVHVCVCACVCACRRMPHDLNPPFGHFFSLFSLSFRSKSARQSLHLLLRRWCSQIPDPPQSLHSILRR